MRWAIIGLAAYAAGLTVSAHAQPSNSDLWIGFKNSEDGFLLDEDTGKLWMTGVCLKSLDTATQSGAQWVSHTVELASVGSVMAVLDQTFRLNTSESGPMISVSSNQRGGEQSFPAVIDRNCANGGHCADLIASQQVCNG